MQRPAFSVAWSASQRIYDPANPAARVADVIGGVVAANIRNSQHPWENTCAVRMSYILNQTGMNIPSERSKTVTGGDRKNYFYRVGEFIPSFAVNGERRKSCNTRCPVIAN